MKNEDVQIECQQLFVKNLQYLEKNHNDIFKQIEQYEISLATNNYLENYTLEYINHSFNIRNVNDSSLLYNRNLDNDAIFRVTKIALDNQNIFKSFELLSENEKSQNQVYLDSINPFIQYIHDLNGEEIKLSRLDKFVFFGSLLGKHIELFVKTYKPKVILIVEQTLEIFKLSLFVTDYSKLNSITQIEFYIGDDEILFTQKIDIFLRQFELSNYMIKYDFSDINYQIMINIFSTRLKKIKSTHFHFGKKLISIDNQLNFMKNKYKFIDFNKVDFMDRFSFLIIDSELSLNRNLNWLQENKDRVLIVAPISFLNILHQLQLKPDIIVITNTDDQTIFNEFSMIPQEFYSKVMFFMAAELSNTILKLFKYNYLYLYQTKFEFLPVGLIEDDTLPEKVIVNIFLKFGIKKLYQLTKNKDIQSSLNYLDISNMSIEQINSQLPISLENTLCAFSEVLNSISKNKHRVKYINLKILIIKNVLKKLYEYQENKYNDCEKVLLDRIELMMEIIQLLNDELGVKVGLELYYSYYDHVEGYFNSFMYNTSNFKKIDEYNTIFQLWLNPQILIFEQYQKQLEEFKLCEYH